MREQEEGQKLQLTFRETFIMFTRPETEIENRQFNRYLIGQTEMVF